MKEFKVYITFTQTIERIINAETKVEAKQKGYKIADELAELKVINVDVDAEELIIKETNNE